MDFIILDLKTRNKNYGIITWNFRQDNEIKDLFNSKDIIEFTVVDEKIKSRKISYKYRRFSINKKLINSKLNSDKIKITRRVNDFFITPL